MPYSEQQHTRMLAIGEAPLATVNANDINISPTAFVVITLSSSLPSASLSLSAHPLLVSKYYSILPGYTANPVWCEWVCWLWCVGGRHPSSAHLGGVFSLNDLGCYPDRASPFTDRPRVSSDLLAIVRHSHECLFFT